MSPGRRRGDNTHEQPCSVSVHSALRADLAPGERQFDFAAQWNRALPLGELRLGAIWSHSPGHRDVLGPQVALLSGWRWTF